MHGAVQPVQRLLLRLRVWTTPPRQHGPWTTSQDWARAKCHSKGVNTTSVEAAFKLESSQRARYAVDRHSSALIEQLCCLSARKKEMFDAGLEDVWGEQMLSSSSRLAELDDTDDEK